MPDETPLIETSSAVATDAGMLALWDAQHFSGVVDYDTWEPELFEDEDVARHVQAGALVPINLRSDGAWQVVVRIGTAVQRAELTARELPYQLVASLPYLYVSTGSVRLSGIEAIEAELQRGVVELPLSAGRYTVTVNLVDWGKEPGSQDASGEPTPTALPDFVVLINPDDGEHPDYRLHVETFDRPEI